LGDVSENSEGFVNDIHMENDVKNEDVVKDIF